MIINILGWDLTIYPAKGGYGRNGVHEYYDVRFTVITRLEIRRLNIEISNIGPKSFVVMSKIIDTRGGMIKKRNLE